MYILGKTCLLERLANGEYSDQQSPTVEEKYDCTLKVNDQDIKMSLQDTMGQEAFRQITQSFYQGCQAIVICYDVTDKNSFELVPQWMEEIKKYTTGNFVPIVLVGNKCDVVDSKAVTERDAEAYAKKNKISFFETSAKQNVNVEDPFIDLVEQLMAGPKYQSMSRDPKALLEAQGATPVKKKSCNLL